MSQENALGIIPRSVAIPDNLIALEAPVLASRLSYEGVTGKGLNITLRLTGDDRSREELTAEGVRQQALKFSTEFERSSKTEIIYFFHIAQDTFYRKSRKSCFGILQPTSKIIRVDYGGNPDTYETWTYEKFYKACGTEGAIRYRRAIMFLYINGLAELTAKVD